MAERLGLAVVREGGMVMAGLALCALIQPDRWVHVGGSAGFYDEHLDMDSLKRTGDKVTVWTRREYVGAQATAWHEIEFDCSTRMETVLAYVRDDGRSVSHNAVRPHREPALVAPGSVSEKIFDIACR